MTKPLIEVERKRIFTGSINTFIATLKTHGFAQTSQLHENDTYYSRPDVDFIQTVECLRVRERDGFAEVTYKPATSQATSTNDGVIMKPETNLYNRAKRCGSRQAIARKPRHDRANDSR